MVHSRSISSLGLALVLFGMSACNTPVQGESGAGPAGASSSGGNGSSGKTDPIPPSGKTCSEAVECTKGCADGDDACVDACVAEGSESAKQKYEALAICLQGSVCNGDLQCLQQQCKYQIDACNADRAPKYEAPLAPGSGSVPAELVGAWYSQSGTYVFNFKDDGTYTETEAAATPGGSGCTGSTVFSYEGIVLFKETTVTLSQTSASKKTTTCSFETTTNPTPTTETKTFFYEGTELYICDEGMTKETCPVHLTKN